MMNVISPWIKQALVCPLVGSIRQVPQPRRKREGEVIVMMIHAGYALHSVI
jgi:hypothetical protein